MAVADTTVTHRPVYRLATRTNGWADLGVTVVGGGASAGVALLRFDGTHYPVNPTLEPLVPATARRDLLIAVPQMPEAATTP